MNQASTPIDKDAARRAWEKLRSKGTATREAAQFLQVGLHEYLDVFCRRYLGEAGYGEACKLVLGSNGEGKTHFLYCIRERALQAGHLVAMVEARNAGAAMSPFVFGQELLLKLEVPSEDQPVDPDENNLVRLLRTAVTRKRESIAKAGLEPDDLIPEWADAIRLKDLQPFGMAQSLGDGLSATVRNDVDGLLATVAGITFQNVRLTKDQQQIFGANLLKSIAKLPRILGFRSLVVLIDEAELAVEGAGRARRTAFLTFLRFINDHMARGDDDSAVVLIACTDDFWPHQFEEYAALKSRLSDPGYDNLEARRDLSLKALVNKNKLWVRETFRGTFADYSQLGQELLKIGSQVLEGIHLDVQSENVRSLSEIASSTEVTPWVKRPFVKALAQTIQDQMDDDRQVRLTPQEVRQKYDLAAKEIAVDDED